MPVAMLFLAGQVELNAKRKVGRVSVREKNRGGRDRRDNEKR